MIFCKILILMIHDDIYDFFDNTYILMLLTVRNLIKSPFSTIHHIRGKARNVNTTSVNLRGIHIKATTNDAPNMIFIPELFDQAENWLPFFTNPNHKALQQRNIYIIYPRNFGNSDHCEVMDYKEIADDIMRFMYQYRISMATLAGHGIGGKIALATGCYHYDKVTGVLVLDSTPTNQYYYEPFHQLRGYLQKIKNVNLHRPFNSIYLDLKRIISCPKWRSVFERNLIRSDSGSGYEWNFNFNNVWANIGSDTPSSIVNWTSLNGLYPGRSSFVFPDYSRYVHLGTNTLPMMKVCPQLKGWNQGITVVQGDQNPMNHWIYEANAEIQKTFDSRITQFLKFEDGVNVLLQNRLELGKATIPDIANARNPRDEITSEYSPAHYYHNWRFKNVYKDN